MNICMLSDMVKKDKRMPLIPDDIIELKNKSTKFNFYIEKFTNIIIEEKEYISVGCKYYTNQKIDLFLSMQGLKQSQIKSNQNYLVLFDVVEYVEQNKAMLNKILKNNCSLLFYDLLSGKHSIKILKSANKEHLLKSTIYIIMILCFFKVSEYQISPSDANFDLESGLLAPFFTLKWSYELPPQ